MSLTATNVRLMETPASAEISLRSSSILRRQEEASSTPASSVRRISGEWIISLLLMGFPLLFGVAWLAGYYL
jgi:hypothetical protein